MKKSKIVKLALITSLITACNSNQPKNDRLHIRGDEKDGYTNVQYYGSGVPYFYYFHPYGVFSSSGTYTRSGYSSGAVSSRSHAHSSSVGRGGFGGSHGGMHVSS